MSFFFFFLRNILHLHRISLGHNLQKEIIFHFSLFYIFIFIMCIYHILGNKKHIFKKWIRQTQAYWGGNHQFHLDYIQ